MGTIADLTQLNKKNAFVEHEKVIDALANKHKAAKEKKNSKRRREEREREEREIAEFRETKKRKLSEQTCKRLPFEGANSDSANAFLPKGAAMFDFKPSLSAVAPSNDTKKDDSSEKVPAQDKGSDAPQKTK